MYRPTRRDEIQPRPARHPQHAPIARRAKEHQPFAFDRLLVDLLRVASGRACVADIVKIDAVAMREALHFRTQFHILRTQLLPPPICRN